MKKVLITPHSEEPDAIAATERTFFLLPGGGLFEREGKDYRRGADYRRVNGKLVLACSNPDFVVFAALEQGYAKGAEAFEDDR